eukprot:72491-Prorocentrum_minimum.AAC.5
MAHDHTNGHASTTACVNLRLCGSVECQVALSPKDRPAGACASEKLRRDLANRQTWSSPRSVQTGRTRVQIPCTLANACLRNVRGPG